MSATTRTAVTLFAEYKKDHEAAMEPCMLCMFEKCPEAEHDKLDALLFDRAMQDPAVMAAEDQREATWRDTPWWRKRYLGWKFQLFALKLRLRTVGRQPPWE